MRQDELLKRSQKFGEDILEGSLRHMIRQIKNEGITDKDAIQVHVLGMINATAASVSAALAELPEPQRIPCRRQWEELFHTLINNV